MYTYMCIYMWGSGTLDNIRQMKYISKKYTIHILNNLFFYTYK